MNPTIPNPIEQARRYLKGVPGAVAGSGGHTAAFKAAMVLVQDFGLSDVEALGLLHEWNATCSPPWSESELRHKVEDARRKVDLERVGDRVRGVGRRSAKRPPVDGWAAIRGWNPAAVKELGGRNQSGLVAIPMFIDCREVGVRLRKPDGSTFEFPGREPHKSHTPAGQQLGLMLSQGMRSGAAPVDADIDLLEGEADCCAAADAGAKCIIGLPGVNFRPEVLLDLQRLLAGHRGRVTMFPDPGAAGEQCGRSVTRALQAVGVSVRIAPPPGKEDLDKRLRREPDRAAALRRWRDRALPAARIYWNNKDQTELTSTEAETPMAEGAGRTELFHLTDLGNAERFTRQHAGKIRYDCGLGRWRWWDGKRWALDTSGYVNRLAFETARTIHAEAAAAASKERMEALSRWACRSESRERLAAMVALAASMESFATAGDRFDADEYVLNVDNGTIDLKTLELRAHDPKDLITKLAPVHYAPDARHEVLERFLETKVPDPDVRHYLQVASGYILLGYHQAEAVFFLYGPKRSGKTTYAEAMKVMLGSYAGRASPRCSTSATAITGAPLPSWRGSKGSASSSRRNSMTSAVSRAVSSSGFRATTPSSRAICTAIRLSSPPHFRSS